MKVEYIARDGKRFTREHECLEYEELLKSKSVQIRSSFRKIVQSVVEPYVISPFQNDYDWYDGVLHFIDINNENDRDVVNTYIKDVRKGKGIIPTSAIGHKILLHIDGDVEDPYSVTYYGTVEEFCNKFVDTIHMWANPANN